MFAPQTHVSSGPGSRHLPSRVDVGHHVRLSSNTGPKTGKGRTKNYGTEVSHPVSLEVYVLYKPTLTEPLERSLRDYFPFFI